VQVSGGSPVDERTFYTALYHSLLHPNVFSDVDSRYVGFDGVVRTAEGRTQYANFSSWDTYKAQNQLLASLWPDRYRDMLLSLLADAREGGKLPRWGEQNLDASHMSGDPVIPMVVDGWCRGVLSDVDPLVVDELFAEMQELVERREKRWHEVGYLPLQTSSRGAGTTLSTAWPTSRWASWPTPAATRRRPAQRSPTPRPSASCSTRRPSGSGRATTTAPG
jgi:putative alpha-1,2-mannosidase